MALRMTSVKQRWENYTDQKRKRYVDCKAIGRNKKFSAKKTKEFKKQNEIKWRR